MVVPKWGGIGAAACSAVSYLAGQGIVMNLYYHKVIGIDIGRFWKNIAGMARVPAMMLIAGIAIVRRIQIEGWVLFFVSVILFTGVYIIGMYHMAMDQYEKDLLKKILRLHI